MTDVPTVALAHGARLPVLGLGTWPMDDAQVARVIPQAVQAGYRLFDTAESYGNARGVGAGLRACGLPREAVFVTTKFNFRWHGRDLVREAFKQSVERLGRSPAQVVLRRHLQLGLSVVPKSADPHRLTQNLEVFDRELDESETVALGGWDRGEFAVVDSDAYGH